MRRAPARLPTVRGVTFNVHSLSAHAVSQTATDRHSRVLRCMKRILSGRDYGLFQETWLGLWETKALKKEFPEWDFFYSNLGRNKGGLLIMVRKKVSSKYDITQLELPAAAT